MQTETYILPAYWASALINNDYSGLEDSDIAEIEKFVNDNKQENCFFSCLQCSDESYFTWRNDAFTLGCDVLEYTFDVTPLNS